VEGELVLIGGRGDRVRGGQGDLVELEGYGFPVALGEGLVAGADQAAGTVAEELAAAGDQGVEVTVGAELDGVVGAGGREGAVGVGGDGHLGGGEGREGEEGGDD
jgi:hypothetical protein